MVNQSWYRNTSISQVSTEVNFYPSFSAHHTAPSSFPSIPIVTNCPFLKVDSFPAQELARISGIYRFTFGGGGTNSVDALVCGMTIISPLPLDMSLSLGSIVRWAGVSVALVDDVF
jgi:hypothetical protein